MFSALGALSNYHNSAVATGPNGVPTDHGNVLRIISPATVPDPSVYQSWDPYLKYVQSSKIVTPIVGKFMGGNHPRFDLSANVDPGGNLVMTGTAAAGAREHPDRRGKSLKGNLVGEILTTRSMVRSNTWVTTTSTPPRFAMFSRALTTASLEVRRQIPIPESRSEPVQAKIRIGLRPLPKALLLKLLNRGTKAFTTGTRPTLQGFGRLFLPLHGCVPGSASKSGSEQYRLNDHHGAGR